MANPSLPKSMRAAQHISGSMEKGIKVDKETPLPKKASNLPPNSTLVKIEYASLNPVDYKLFEASIFRSLLVPNPAIPSSDFSGTVVSTTLPRLKPGDRVFGRLEPPKCGALGEYAVVQGNDNIIALPDNVSLQDGSCVGIAGLTAYQCIAPYVRSGSKVFINGGSGGTGSFGIQIAKALGCSVTTTCSGPNVQLCKDLGADEVIDYKTTDVVEHLKRQGTQYDLLVDNVDVPAIYWNAHHYLKPEGRYVAIAGSISLSSVASIAQILLLPSWLGGGKRKAKFLMLAGKDDEYEKLAGMMNEGKVKPVVEKVYELEDASEAFARLKSGRTRGKLVIRVARN